MSTNQCNSASPRWLSMALALSLVGALPEALVSARFSGPPPYLVPAAAFDLNGVAGTDYFFSFGSAHLQQVGSTTSCFQAPVYLPDSFRVGGLALSGYDSSASDFEMEMKRVSYLNSSFLATTMASASTSGASGFQTPADDSILGSTIDNNRYAYFLATCLAGSASTNLRVYAVRIDACVGPNLLVDAAKLAGGDDFTACDTLTSSGTVTVSNGRDVEFVAGSKVALVNGFTVQDEATFMAGTDLGLLPPPPL